MITTRQASALHTRNSYTYRLDLLNESNAENLFCHWAFGQNSIPAWVEEPQVVKEVISECKGLPLALRVIGTSLSTSAGQSPAVYWRVARDKLRDAKPLGEYHKDALLGRLRTSIDALDPMLQECFLDLGAYPQNSEWSTDALLDVCVYVRGMEWVDAVLALVELASRSLLDFPEIVTSVDIGHALESNRAGGLRFSQHDVMRDLVLQLGAKDHPPCHRKRLVMPRRSKNIPSDWQSEEAAMAEVISIHTGGITEEQDWPTSLAFPHARALFLQYFQDGFIIDDLPPFLSSMCRLKVLFIRGAGLTIASTTFEGLVELQSLHIEGVEGVSCLSGTNLPKLEKLRLIDVDEIPTSLIHGLSQYLKFLEVDGLELEELPENLGEIRALTYISLSQCYHLKSLPQSFGNLNNLHTLALHYCSSLSHLPTSFGLLVGLKKLDMSWYKRLQDLSENFGCLVSLEILILANCRNLKELPQSFGWLNNLKELDLSGCEKLKGLPVINVGQLGRLKKLDLSHCFGMEKLPESFGNLHGLEHLMMKDCTRLRHLPVRFGELRSLQYLSLDWCRRLQDLPVSFGQLSGLRTLKMRKLWTLKGLPAAILGRLVGGSLERVECDERLVPHWKALYPPGHPALPKFNGKVAKSSPL
ncbi:hypothetical protein L7F22_035421 [Adiantum nelumboides]|nr:hypothetical protein [Adiantum nelumboides]